MTELMNMPKGEPATDESPERINLAWRTDTDTYVEFTTAGRFLDCGVDYVRADVSEAAIAEAGAREYLRGVEDAAGFHDAAAHACRELERQASGAALRDESLKLAGIHERSADAIRALIPAERPTGHDTERDE